MKLKRVRRLGLRLLCNASRHLTVASSSMFLPLLRVQRLFTHISAEVALTVVLLTWRKFVADFGTTNGFVRLAVTKAHGSSVGV